jgi:hypothetical protein
MWGWDPNPGPIDRQVLFQQPFALAAIRCGQRSTAHNMMAQTG